MAALNRRQFLGTTGAMAAGHLVASRLLADAPSETIGIGCIGVGGRGTALLRNLLTIKRVAVRAICDIKPAHLERAQTLVTGAGQNKPEGTDQWKKLLEMKEVDAVISALPCDLHAANYLDVLAAGKDLYGEKPMCLTPADCDAVVAAAQKSKQIVQIGFQRRADPRFIETIKQVHDGELGDLVEGRIMWSNAWGPPKEDWFGLRARSGDWMVEQACHNWDVLNWANRGLPIRAMGLGRTGLFRERQPDRDVHDYYSAVVEYDNGVLVNILHSWVAPGQQGAFNPKFNDEHTRLIGVKAGIDFNTGTFSYRKELNKPDRVGHSYKGEINNTLLALQAFIESVRTRKPPVATVEHGRNAVLACLLVREGVYKKTLVTMKELVG
jgi:predicted dehydrogenase